MPSSARAPSAIARAIGCSLASSAPPASRRSSVRETPSAGIASSSHIRPSVTVPVLSRTIVVIRRVRSSTSGPLIRIPSCAPRPVPTIRAVGVARPSAHGHAMMSTATEAVKASVGSPVSASQPTRVARESASTIGTKTAETRSTSRWMGALPACASSTSRAICASAVSPPTRVARTSSRPNVLTVPPATSSPGPTSTGTGSPVSIERSTAESPSSITPSVAIFSPGRTMKRSPVAIVLDGDDHLPPVAEHARVLRPELQQGPDRGARSSAGARLEEAAEQDQRRDHGRDLEVRVRVVERDEPDHGPRPGGQGADRDQRVHRGGAVARVQGGRAVERPAGPPDDRRRERECEPLPPVELEWGSHREHGERRAQGGGDDESGAEPVGRRVVRSPRARRHRRDTRRPRRRGSGPPRRPGSGRSRRSPARSRS